MLQISRISPGGMDPFEMVRPALPYTPPPLSLSLSHRTHGSALGLTAAAESLTQNIYHNSLSPHLILRSPSFQVTKSTAVACEAVGSVMLTWWPTPRDEEGRRDVLQQPPC